MKWLQWSIIYLIFWMFGKRTLQNAGIAGGQWQFVIMNWTLQLETNDNYGQRKYTLFRDETGVAVALFDDMS
jgi:hypothetical protein